MLKFYKPLLTLLLIALSFQISFSQAPKRATSADIHDAIKRLNVLGSALFVAAHPDDENTRLISYLSNHLRVNTAYLSMTRGGGGQNLIGPEISELLGVIRTQELLMARSVDGGQQFFTRAIDFGYSKHPDETLNIWNEKEVLSDVVWTIRKFQPDVIINRFDHESAGRTHGHHTTSAILSHQAFDLAGDKTAYPEQLQYVDTWQAKRLYFNTSWWFYGSRENFEKADKSKMTSVDTGVYYPLKGKSNNEIAAESRSMHKCQGMGSTPSRGTQSEYLELLKGNMPKNKENIFDGINTTWTRLKGGAPIGEILQKVEDNFDYENPGASVPQLMKALQQIKKLPDSYWKRVKLKEITQVIQSCMALYLEATADDYTATPGQSVELALEAINRSDVDAQLESVSYLPMGIDSTLALPLDNNQVYKFYKKISLPEDIETTSPYWLDDKGSLGMYKVENQLLRGLAETPRAFRVHFKLRVAGLPLDVEVPVVYKKTDPVKGEVYRPFEVTIPVFSQVTEKVYVFANEEPKTVQVLVKAGKENLSGTVELCYPENWKVEPERTEFEMSQKGEEQTFSFQLYPPEEQTEGLITSLVNIDGKSYTDGMFLIEYDHIPTQTVVQDASAKIVKIELKKVGKNIGYVMGAGDDIPASLKGIGYEVTILEDSDINLENLNRFDAVIMGVRAYNTVERLKFHQAKLLKYVEEGGTLIAQYNTSRGLVTNDLAPYPLKLSRDRVSVEEAEVRFLNPDHAVLNFPNKITAKDFEGWVQERGLYFPDEWDENFTAILSSNDPGESPKDGGLLVAKYGKGYYIYTGYSWFRELPAGVPGAYRLFANMISIGKRP